MSDSIELPTGAFVPIQDTICECYHWYEEHNGECHAPNCTCANFVADPVASTAAAIADRGGDPEQWPEHVKNAVKELADEADAKFLRKFGPDTGN